MSNVNQYEKWVSDASARIKQASAKVAAAQSELNVSDPTDQGHAAAPAKHDGNNLSLLGVPTPATNTNETDMDRKIVAVTDPNGTGEGEYITPKNGDAQDAAATSPTASLDKIAANLNAAVAKLQGAQTDAEKQAATQQPTQAAETTPATPEKQAATQTQEFTITPGFSADQDIMRKLASVGAVMIGTEEGQQAVRHELARQGGIKEAAAMINEARQAAAAYVEQEKQASVQQQVTPEQIAMEKAAAAGVLAHNTWYNGLKTDFEKNAYAQGAVDGEAAADALAANSEPTIDGAEGLSDQDAVAVVQAMVQNGEITPEEGNMILSAASSPEALMQELGQLVQAQEITPEEAQALAAQLMGEGEGEAAPEGGEEVPEDVSGAAEEGVKSAAAIVNDLFSK